MNEQARNTKVIWSFDAHSLNQSIIKDIDPGRVDALRIVYNPQQLKTTADFLKKLNACEKDVPIMLDIAANVRASVTGLNESIELEYDQQVTLTPEGGSGDLQIKTNVWKDLFTKDVMIFLGYGNVLLKAEKINDEKIEAKVIQGGAIYPGIEVHIPATRKPGKFESAFIKNLYKSIETHVDFLVVPAFTSVQGLRDIKDEISKHTDMPPWILLKVNSEQVITNIDSLLEEVDGIFLFAIRHGVNCRCSHDPSYFKGAHSKANDSAKLVVVASEMLGSMRYNATPTRAEVSDVANAVRDGADAVVLSEEVTQGPHAKRAEEIVGRIIVDAEEKRTPTLNWRKTTPELENEMDAVSYGAFTSSERMNAKAIVCITQTGNTALSLAAYRGPFPIISVTFSHTTKRRLSLIRGVKALVLDSAPSIDDVLPLINDQLVKMPFLEPGDRIVFVSVTLSPIGKDSSNLFTIQRLNEKIHRT